MKEGLLFLSFICLALSLVLQDDFNAPKDRWGAFCFVNLTQDHAGWSTRQPPQEWVNITFNATFSWIQVTRGHPGSGYAIGWTIDYSDPITPMTLHVNYWGVFETLFYSTWPAPCTRYHVRVLYGSHV